MLQNLLITSAGRRGMLVQLFQKELRQRFPKAQVLAGDLRPELSAACRLADGYFELPSVRSDEYIDCLISECISRKVGMVVPTIDTELLTLAKSRDRFAEHGIAVVISDVPLVQSCRDKRQTNELFKQIGLNVPAATSQPTADDLPLFARPFDGSCSVDTHVLRKPDDITSTLLDNPRMTFAEYLDPAQHDEYTIDMYYDRQHDLKCVVPRLRLETRAGEVSKGRTTKLPEIDALWSIFSNLRGAIGCLTVQVFRHRESGKLFGIEINPRFGGGYPLSYQAGANFPGWLLDEYLLNQSVESHHGWENDLTMLRYDGQVFVRGSAA